jgi:predicted ester cyclase
MATQTATQTEQNLELVRRVLTELDSGNRDIVDELYSPNFQLHFPGSPPLDLEGLKQLVNTFYGAFPDLKHTIDDMVAVDDKVVLRVRTMRHTRGSSRASPRRARRLPSRRLPL